MTPRLAEILAAMIEVVLAAEAGARPPDGATIRRTDAQQRRGSVTSSRIDTGGNR
jgi:hypothetical protein